MKETGIIRRVDDLGRIVIPKEIRRTLRIREGDPMEIFLEDGAVIFKKYSPLTIHGNINAAVAAMNRARMSFAIYDRDRMLTSSTPERFPHLTPALWDDYRAEFTDEGTKARVYPLLLDGELLGYLAVFMLSQSDEGFAKAIAAMLPASIA